MELLVVLVLSSGVTVSTGLVFLCYRLCCRRKPAWQTDYLPPEPGEYIPMIHPPHPPVSPPIEVQPPDPPQQEISHQPLPPDPPKQTPRRPPNPKPPNLKLEIARRFAEGKIAELEMGIFFRNNVLEMTIRKIDKIHDSINKKEAYVRVKNPRERKISVPMLKYSNNFQALLGSHNFRFNITRAQLQDTVFRFYLWSVDKYSRQREFGEFALDFGEVTKTRNLNAGYLDKFDFLVYDTTPQEKDPCIRLRLKYHCKSGKVIVSVLEVRDLHQPSSPVLPAGTYVKVIFSHSHSGRQRQYKTKLVKGRSPQFHTTFNHDVQLGDLADTTLSVQIKSKALHTDTLSVLEFGSDATGRLGEHWTQMVQGIEGGYGVEMTHRISQEKRRPMNFTRRITTTTLF